MRKNVLNIKTKLNTETLENYDKISVINKNQVNIYSTKIESFNSNYSPGKYSGDESNIRLNMDELNKKIRAGDIFNDNKNSVKSNFLNSYHIVV